MWYKEVEKLIYYNAYNKFFEKEIYLNWFSLNFWVAPFKINIFIYFVKK